MTAAPESAPLGHWIAGEPLAPADRPTATGTNPSTGEPSTAVVRGTPTDVDRAARAADTARRGWRLRKPVERGRILTELARLIIADADRLAALEAAETGKPDPRGEIVNAAAYFEFYGGLVNAVQGETVGLGPGYHSFTEREPFGVVGVITPWNAPLNQAARAVAPALAAGNAVVVKPSEFTSTTTVALARLATEAGLPDGVLNVVTGTGDEAGAALVDHPAVRKLAFTGSLRAGRLIGRAAADRILPLTLELGGKSANIVFADADLDAAVAGSLQAFTANSGQACSAGTRLLVQRSAHDEFVARLRAAAQELTDSGELGPLTTAAQFDKVNDYYRTAVEDGAKPLIGGEPLPEDVRGGGYFVPPTIYTDVSNDMRVAREEIFGPVLVVIPFEDDAEALSIANDSPYGLASGVWTSDISRALTFARDLEAGHVYVNTWLGPIIETPFGGYKMSGYGREKGIEALHHYTQVKSVTFKL